MNMSLGGYRVRQMLILAVLLLAAITAWTGSWNAVSRSPVLPPAGTVQTGHKSSGAVRPPRPLPPMTVLLNNSETSELKSLLAGRWTLAQLIFTGCSTTCPIQGAIFSKAQADMKAADLDVEFLSISIDPFGDDAKALTKWLDSFGGGPRWRAAVPTFDNLGPLLDALGGRGKGVDIHDARVYLIGPDGHLQYITEEMPGSPLLVSLVRSVQAGAISE
jgi:protein SCO1/2